MDAKQMLEHLVKDLPEDYRGAVLNRLAGEVACAIAESVLKELRGMRLHATELIPLGEEIERELCRLRDLEREKERREFL